MAHPRTSRTSTATTTASRRSKARRISSNTGYLRLSNSIGQASTTEMASRLGVTSPMQPVYTATEGVADVNPLEMASAYATLASGA